MKIPSRVRPVFASSVMAAAIVVMLVEPAFAQAAGIETVLQNIVTMLTGNIAKLLAVIAVIVICIAWMFGYMDLRRAGFWIIGIGGIFGATELVNTIVGG
ncbi:Type IV secretory pathway AvhB2 protein (plasmid) [Agrobacterium tumefaciens]|uniref:Type IV secretory pathway AvhB2 protein n=1 Tax=Agrobacterium tumefaciens TaxID=358 RepID=A0AAP9EAA5_AGRTU|nr:TrbC/VirB2 family protein [Agrobacterium tumefaciens]NSZ61106.1 Type IV secretory pathway AvhB2 protein [Agrobacterium tumefaciens]QDY97526.1 Type IV secretory pathway AvhB2 protein [Agrobacterium tumefaciens]UXS12654.1 Type IV secretory pathway AvhB2 protein [Agrobacterium tumefaciens]UXS20015.1 Type IV secretory pathway AvhB2 protein [Agrobacterium tumefaciens]UXS27663.1 Type IV secretory pathway AvhB2 protein [Agrobacterium tumefaciens]